MYNMLVLECKQ